MTSLSDRQQDAFDNPAKMTCREGNLRVLREAAFLLWQDGDRTRLRCDWCELMGASGLLTLELLERQGVLGPGGFVGIDLDPVRIAEFRQSRPDLKWVAGNLYERLDAPELANVGILNLDEYGEIGTRSAETDLPFIHRLVRRGFDESSCYCALTLAPERRGGRRPAGLPPPIGLRPVALHEPRPSGIRTHRSGDP